jgi:hypothetical protein
MSIFRSKLLVTCCFECPIIIVLLHFGDNYRTCEKLSAVLLLLLLLVADDVVCCQDIVCFVSKGVSDHHPRRVRRGKDKFEFQPDSSQKQQCWGLRHHASRLESYALADGTEFL